MFCENCFPERSTQCTAITSRQITIYRGSDMNGEKQSGLLNNEKWPTIVIDIICLKYVFDWCLSGHVTLSASQLFNHCCASVLQLCECFNSAHFWGHVCHRPSHPIQTLNKPFTSVQPQTCKVLMHQQLCEYPVDFGPKVHKPHRGCRNLSTWLNYNEHQPRPSSSDGMEAWLQT